MTFFLPNGKPIDGDMLELAMQDADGSRLYFLNLQTGEVSTSDDVRTSGEEDMEEEHAIPVERIDSREAYQWMSDFVDDVVAPKNARIAAKLSLALRGKGAFRRFKDAVHSAGNEWEQAWYDWKDDRFEQAIKAWLMSLPIIITERAPDEL
jgi:hypothetical protein